MHNIDQMKRIVKSKMQKKHKIFPKWGKWNLKNSVKNEAKWTKIVASR